MCKYMLALALFVAFIPGSVSAQDVTNANVWSYSVNAGSVFMPSYLGADNYKLNALVDVRITHTDRFFGSLLQGVGYNVIKTDNWRIGPIVRYDFGRDEDGSNPLALAGDDTDALLGLGDVDGAFEFGGFVEYSLQGFSAKIEARQAVNGHKGFLGEAEITYGDSFSIFDNMAFFAFGPNVVFGNTSYTSAYFDVSPVQSAASGLSAFDADGGLVSYGLKGSIVMLLSNHVSLVGFASYSRLGGDPANSSLVLERGEKNQGMGGILLNYRF